MNDSQYSYAGKFNRCKELSSNISRTSAYQDSSNNFRSSQFSTSRQKMGSRINCGSVDLKNFKKTRLVYDDNRVEIYSPDGSIFVWKNHQILHISKKGIANHITLQTLLQAKSEQLIQKLAQSINILNNYGCQHKFIDIGNRNKDHIKSTFSLKYKIQQFSWVNPQIQEVKVKGHEKLGFKIISDDKLASLTLHPNLYLVTIQYPQYVQTSVDTDCLMNVRNMTKQLLTKYNYQYTQFPQRPKNYERDYQYRVIDRYCTIFNVPFEWQYPLWVLWKSLTSYGELNEGVAYIQYDWINNHDGKMSKISKTKMPQLKNIKDYCQKSTHDSSPQKLPLPIMGRINHQAKCSYISIQSHIENKDNIPLCEAWFCHEYKVNLLTDGIGFWFTNQSMNKSRGSLQKQYNQENLEFSQFIYRQENKRQIDQSFYIHAIPYKIRIKGQPQRILASQLSIFASYAKENQKNKIKESIENDQNYFNQSEGVQDPVVVHEQAIEDDHLGGKIYFKAYNTGVVYLKIPSEKITLILITKENSVKIVSKLQKQPIYINLSSVYSHTYLQYEYLISKAIEYRNRILMPDKHREQCQFNQQLEGVLQRGQIYVLGCQYLQKYSK